MTPDEFPVELVNLTRCAELFTMAGKPVDRTNLGRFIIDRNFPFVEDGREKLVDARALWATWSNDYSRQVMSGETTKPLPDGAADAPPGEAGAAAGGDDGPLPPSSAGPSTQAARDRFDPKREEAAVKLTHSRLDLAQRLKQLVPASEVSAAQAEAIAELDAAAAQAVGDAADRILQKMGAPSSKIAELRAELKRFIREAREKFADRLAHTARALNEPDSQARRRLDRLVEFDQQLRESADEPAEPALAE